MSRWLACSLVLLAALCCFCARPAPAQAPLDPNDTFDDGVLDASRWVTVNGPGEMGSTEERDGLLAMTRGAGEYYRNELHSLWVLPGEFDLQIDYHLTQWPTSPYLGISLTVESASDRATVCRYQNEGSDAYVGSYVNAGVCTCAGSTATADMSGTLRLVREADSTLTEYYWSAESGSWVAFPAGSVSGEARLSLTFDSTTDQPAQVTFDNFRVNSGAVVSIVPSIDAIEIDRGPSTNLWGEPGYHQRVALRVRATWAASVACVIIDDPGGGQYVMSTCKGGGWPDWSSPTSGDQEYWYHEDPDYSVTCGFYEGGRSVPPEAGAYRIQVNFYGGDPVVYLTPEVPALAEGEPTLALVSPGIDAVTDQTQPMLVWTGAPYANLQVRAHPDGAVLRPTGDDEGLGWSTSLTAQSSVTYNDDGSGLPLEPGRTSVWEVTSRAFVGDLASSPHVSLWTSQVARRRLAVYAPYPAPLPELPGKLGFIEWLWGDRDSGHTAVRAYSPDPGVQEWLTPEGPRGSADLSWDGTKLLYQRRSGQLWVRDYATGLPAAQVPGANARYEASWSPDGNRVVYTSRAEGAAGVWVVNEDGTDPVRLVPTEAKDVRYSRWSPDGAWISYQLCCDANDGRIWLTRADGTESRELRPSITGVTGYPGYTVSWVTAPVWSPDARHLALTFTAVSADESDGFIAIGVMPREGGDITAVFINPPGYVCCARPEVSCWSPDGTALVFSSGFHLPVDPEWANAKGEPGVEMWMASADGSGALLRLTYNSSYDHYATWWAPNTPAGGEVSVVKGEAAVTFAQVTAEGSTRLSIAPDLPGPLPAGCRLVSDLWSGATTADYQGGITIALPYDAVLAGSTRALALLQWNPVKGKWRDVTTRPVDPDHPVIGGQTETLGVFAICLREGRPAPSQRGSARWPRGRRLSPGA